MHKNVITPKENLELRKIVFKQALADMMYAYEMYVLELETILKEAKK